jgi:tetratricopeptide (TPR) repeat protein
MEEKKELVSYLNNLSYFLLGILFLVFPIFFLSFTTDPYVLPKQALLGGISLLLLIIYGVKTIAEKSVRARRTPFDVPVIFFAATLLLSSLFATNQIDSLINFIPVLFAVIIYFAITNGIKDKKPAVFLTSLLIIGAVVAALISILAQSKIYIFPYDFTKVVSFSTVGSVLDLAIYLVLILPLAGYFVLREKSATGSALKKKVGFSIASLVILMGLISTIYSLITQQRPVLLPFETGFQTAFAAISQDTGRIIQGFLFGSGFGNYGVVFTKFKQALFNLNPTYWSFIFYRSSSFVLELLATTGVLGFIAYLFLCYKIVKEKPLSIPLVLVIIASFILPFSFIEVSLLLILLGLYTSTQGIGKANDNRYFDVEFELVALKKGLIAFEEVEGETKKKNKSLILPIVAAVVLFAVSIYIGYLSINYVSSNVYFQKSLVAAAQNNGTLTYQNQTTAVNTFKYSDNYYRVFSQTNMALANSLAASIPQGSSPSAQVSQTIYTLIQQSINAGRTATTLSPQTALNWQNLSSIYRSLIGFGQNADRFAILANQQAVLLDPNNPQEYINLGGIYYQLGLWDQAGQQFQIAISLKPDMANAYYNLGHTLENQGKLNEALTQYQNAKSLLANDKTNLDVINKEIEALTNKIQTGQTAQTGTEQAQQPTEELNVAAPTTVLPTQNPPVKIPGISASPVPTKEPSPAPTTTTVAP